MLMYVYMHTIDLYISEAACLEIYVLVGCTKVGDHCCRSLDQFLFETDRTKPGLLLLLLEHPHPQQRLPPLALLVLRAFTWAWGCSFQPWA